MLQRDGFPGERLRVLPAPLVTSALAAPLTRRLLVTDAGWFPHAVAHGRVRPRGAREAIVLVCTDGVGWLEARDGRHRIGPGDAAVISPGTPHRYVADSEDPWTIWWLHATGDDLPDLLDPVLGDASDAVVPLRDVYSAAALVEHAVVSLERDETAASLYTAAGSAWQLFAKLASDRLRGRPAAADRIRIAQDYLRDNLAASIAVPELARLAGLSTSHFSALFRAAAGIGVVEYLRRLRAARARELLLTTDASVAEIGAAVGYADPFYFSRQFRAVTGTSPTVFRTHGRRDAVPSPASSPSSDGIRPFPAPGGTNSVL